MKFRSNISHALVYFFVLFSVSHQLIGTKEDLIFLRLAQLCGLLSFFWVLIKFDSIYWRDSTSFRVLIVSLVSMGLVNVFRGQFYVLNGVYPLSFFAVGLIIRYSRVSVTFFYVLTIVVFAWLAFLAFSGLPASDWIKGSRNHVSVLVIYIVMLTQIICLLQRGTGNVLSHLIFPICAVIFSVAAVGRSGIITSVALLACSVLYLIVKDRKPRISQLVIISILGFLLAYSVDWLSVGSDYLYKFETKGLELAEREDVINDYINETSFLEVFIGHTELDFYQKDITLHNSFLHWHMNYGFGAFLIGFLTIRCVWSLRKGYFAVLYLLLILLARSFSDQILLSDGILMGLPLFVIFNWQGVVNGNSVRIYEDFQGNNYNY